MGFKTGLAATMVAGAVFTGAVFTWDGGTNLDTVKTKITEQANKLNVFKQNEGKLIGKVSDLKAEIIALKSQIEQLIAEGGDQTALIADLQNQITQKQAELVALQAELDADGNALAAEINRLQGELDKANQDAEALETFATTTQSAEPDQTAVDAALDGETVTPPPVEEETPPPATTYTQLKMIDGTPVTVVEGLVVDKRTDGSGTNLIIENFTGNKDYAVYVDGVKLFDITNGESKTIGSAANLDGKHLHIERIGGVGIYDFTLINQ